MLLLIRPFNPHLSSEWKTSLLLLDNRCIDLKIGRRFIVRTEYVQLLKAFRLNHFMLPRYRHRASVELGVEILVVRVNLNSFHSAELLNVKNVFGVHSVRLKSIGKRGGEIVELIYGKPAWK